MSTTPPSTPAEPVLPYGVIVKDSTVKLAGLNPQLLLWLVKAGAVHVALYYSPLIITSAVDGNHVASSKHGKGDAVDVRINDLPAPSQPSLLLILRVQSAQFGLAVFDESFAPGMGHVHVEIAG